MSIFTWSEQFVIGIPSVDSQHRHLVDLLNQLDDMVAIGEDHDAILSLISALTDYSQYHFSHEEQLMFEGGYDKILYAKHCLEHQQFIERVASESAKLASEPELVINELLAFLVAWLSEHILVSDKQMALMLRKQIGDEDFLLQQQKSEIMQGNLFAALRESENRFKQLADRLPASIWLSNAKRQLIFVNRFCRSMFGFGDESINLERWVELIDANDREQVQQAYEAATLSHQEQKIEYRLLRNQQPPLWILETVAPRLRSNGQFAGLIGCGMDITVKKQTEAELERQVTERTAQLLAANQTLEEEKNWHVLLNRKMAEIQSQLIQSEKMASLGQLAAGVAHEINNPLGYISSNLGTLKQYHDVLLEVLDLANHMAQQLPQDNVDVSALKNLEQKNNMAYIAEDLRDLVVEAQEGANRAKKIVQDLREFSHTDKVERALFDLEGGIEATMNIVHNELKYKAKIIRDFGGVRPFICIGSQINQVIMNLLVNAAQAIEQFGTITIRTGEIGDESIWFEVEDSGQGMVEEIQSKIFDPFFTTKPVGKGTGLGLSLSYRIIQEHQGYIKVHSQAGKGTCFHISLPRIFPET